MLLEVARETARETMWVGPVPSPDTLADYKAIDPGFPSLLLAEFQATGANRRRCEFIRTATESILSIGGLLVAGGLAFYALWIGYSLTSRGQEVGGIALMLTAMAGLLGVFIYGKRQQGAPNEDQPTVIVADPELVETGERRIERLKASASRSEEGQ